MLLAKESRVSVIKSMGPNGRLGMSQGRLALIRNAHKTERKPALFGKNALSILSPKWRHFNLKQAVSFRLFSAIAVRQTCMQLE